MTSCTLRPWSAASGRTRSTRSSTPSPSRAAERPRSGSGTTRCAWPSRLRVRVLSFSGNVRTHPEVLPARSRCHTQSCGVLYRMRLGWHPTCMTRRHALRHGRQTLPRRQAPKRRDQPLGQRRGCNAQFERATCRMPQPAAVRCVPPLPRGRRRFPLTGGHEAQVTCEPAASAGGVPALPYGVLEPAVTRGVHDRPLPILLFGTSRAIAPTHPPDIGPNPQKTGKVVDDSKSRRLASGGQHREEATWEYRLCNQKDGRRSVPRSCL